MSRALLLRPDHDLTARLRAAALATAVRSTGWQVVERDGDERMRSRPLPVTITVGRPPSVLAASLRVHDVGVKTEPAPGLDLVVCADDATAAAHRAPGGEVVVAPTRIDTDAFQPPLAPRPFDALPRIGWLGGPHGAEGLLALRAALGRLGHRYRYALDVSGADGAVDVPGVVVRRREPPRLETVADVLRTLDVLLVTPGPGASGAALTAAACGVPVVAVADAAPEVVCGTLGERAATEEDLVVRLDALLGDPERRAAAAVRGREQVVREWRLQGQLGPLREAFTRLVEGR